MQKEFEMLQFTQVPSLPQIGEHTHLETKEIINKYIGKGWQLVNVAVTSDNHQRAVYSYFLVRG